MLKSARMRYFLLVFFLLSSYFGWSTHNRAGYITYEQIGDFEDRYFKVTITTCTKLSSTAADREKLQICWGDGTRDTLNRVLPTIDDLFFDVRQNSYIGYHTYNSNGVFTLEVYDPNRNEEVQNIIDAVNTPFCITTQLIISPFLGKNSSAQFNYCPCPEYACTFQPYAYNPGAFDPDGDSLSFEMVPCRGLKDCGGDRLACCFETCPFMAVGTKYFYVGTPALGGGGTAALNPVSGTLNWTSPQTVGEYNIAILVHEWRKMPNGAYAEIGNVTLDYQITVSGQCENNAPALTQIDDTCVVAGTTVNFTIQATDPDATDNLTMTASGQPFEFTTDPATFSVPGNGIGDTLIGAFNWTTSCAHVSNTSYLVTIAVEDDDQGNTGPVFVPLAAYESFLIRVIPPAVTGVTATSSGNSIVVNWIPQLACSDADGYKIYRSNTPITNSTYCCSGSTPEDLGYTYVGTVTGINSDEFIDASTLSVGQNYCYVVVLYYDEGSVSCPSDPACAQLKAEFPLMTRVSIDVTDLTAGTDTVEWFYPYELDTINPPFNKGNFYYELYRSVGVTVPSTLVFTSVISSSISSVQRVFFDTGLNTDNNQFIYNVRLYHVDSVGTTTYIGQSTPATSVFLTLSPNDNQMGLSWTATVPWINTRYDIYRETPTGSGNFVYIDSTSATSYVDTGLVNGHTYCYRIKAYGLYSAPEVPSPLINWSQEECAEPTDLTPPCAPTLTIEADCDAVLNTLTWNNPNNSCADDVMAYNVYYSPTDTGTYTLINQINLNTDTILLHQNDSSIAGCYYVTAIDSAQYGNESAPSDTVCVDNCPYYFLPNVFTPNGDGENDYFTPFPYKYIKDIELKIFDRWGVLVFETTDPKIKWDGKYAKENKLLSDGVYYYVCKVNSIRLTGIDTIDLHGFVHLISKGNNTNN